MENESNSPDLTKESTPLPDEQASLGAWLQSHRMKQNLAPSDIENITKYSSRQIKALENNEWDTLPTGFSLRALVRRYVKVLGLDEEEAMRRLEKEHGDASLKKIKADNMISSLDHEMGPIKTPIDESSGGARWLWLLLALILIIIIVLFVLISQGVVDPAALHLDFLKNWFNSGNE